MSSPAATAPTRTSRRSPGPRTSSAGGSSTTRMSCRSGSCASTPEGFAMSDRILRLQHVQIRVPDLELCTAYYTEVLGLIETAHEENRVFLKCWDEHEHHSVVLRQAPTYGLDHMSFKVAELDDLDHYTERVEGVGIPVKRYGRGELGPG